LRHSVELDEWQLSGWIATRAARRALHIVDNRGYVQNAGHSRGRKVGAAVLLCVEGRAGSPSNTMSPGPKRASVPSGILIHPTVWPQWT